MATRHNSYIRDMADFLDKVRAAKLSKKDLLFTMKADRLYTNIKVKTGLTTVPRAVPSGRPTEQLLQLLELLLTQNDFQYNSDTYLEIKGMAMRNRGRLQCSLCAPCGPHCSTGSSTTCGASGPTDGKTSYLAQK